MMIQNKNAKRVPLGETNANQQSQNTPTALQKHDALGSLVKKPVMMSMHTPAKTTPTPNNNNNNNNNNINNTPRIGTPNTENLKRNLQDMFGIEIDTETEDEDEDDDEDEQKLLVDTDNDDNQDDNEDKKETLTDIRNKKIINTPLLAKDATKEPLLKKPKIDAGSTETLDTVATFKRSIGGASMVTPMNAKILPIQSLVQEINGKRRLTTAPLASIMATPKNVLPINNTTTSTNNTKLLKLQPLAAVATPSLKKTSTTQTKTTQVDNTGTSMNLKSWQQNWKLIMKRETCIYFDVYDKTLLSSKFKERKDFLENLEVIKEGYMALGAVINLSFNKDVTIVISLRGNEPTFINDLAKTDVLKMATLYDMKIWTLEKATRFLNHLEVDLNPLKSKVQHPSYPIPTTNVVNYLQHKALIKSGIKARKATGSKTKLSQYLQNEKIYGTMDKDPLAKRDDMHYFNKDRPHIYIYDLSQQFSPLVVMEWKINGTNGPLDKQSGKEGVLDLPYPTLQKSTFGRCPFIPDNDDEMSKKRIFKRFKKDRNQEKHAIFLKRLYSTTATPNPENDIFIIDQKEYNNSEKMFCKTFGSHSQDFFQTTSTNKAQEPPQTVKESQQQIQDSHTPAEETVEDVKFPEKVVWKRPPLKNSLIAANLLRMETTGLEDSCNPHGAGLDGKNHNMSTSFSTNNSKKRIVLSEIKASGVLNNDASLAQSGSGTNLTTAQLNNVLLQNNNGLAATKSTVIGKNLSMLNSKFITMESTTVAKASSPEDDKPPKRCGDVPAQTAVVLPPPLAPAALSLLATTHGVSSKTHVTKPVAQDSKPTTPAIKKAVNTVAMSAAIRDKKMGGGYCENCRVKYDSLRAHIKTEKHAEFSRRDKNFQAIDSLIEVLNSSMY